MKVYPSIAILALTWFSAGFSGSIHAAVCDVDNDGDVDRLDLRMIASARNTPSAGPADSRDADADGAITTLDMRACIGQCSLAGCKIIDPAPPAPGNDARDKAAADADPKQAAAKTSARPKPATSAQSRSATEGEAIFDARQWEVRRGDTLYSISRAVFPRDPARQARFRQDVMELNPSVFANGANNMAVGAVLELPDYVGSDSAAGRTDQAALHASTAADTVTPGMTPRPVDADPVIESAPEKPSKLASSPKTETKLESEPKIGNEPAARGIASPVAANEVQARASVSLGYSQGGDRLDDTGDARDLDAGSGVHLRLGFEQMSRRGSGYRMALGLQYNLARNNGDDATFRDAYLQTAYQHRAAPIVYGIGLAVHTGATLKAESTRQYDPAVGAVVYLENVGNSALSGWGLSYTHLEIEEQDGPDSIDASRAELYYSWRF